MPPRKVKGGYKNPGTKNRPLSKKKAQAQHRAMKARKSRKGR